MLYITGSAALPKMHEVRNTEKVVTPQPRCECFYRTDIFTNRSRRRLPIFIENFKEYHCGVSAPEIFVLILYHPLPRVFFIHLQYIVLARK